MKSMQRRRETTFRLSSLVAAVALVGSGLFYWVIVVNAASAATGHKAKSIAISTAKNSQFGTILVSGTTLYTLKASKTPCTAQCIKIWPEVLLPKGMKNAKAGTGVNAAKLGTVKRAHGALQVTYAGKPLYWFSGDTAGQVNGNITDIWGKWSVFVTAKLSSASAAPVSPTPVSPPPTTSSGHSTSPTPTSPPPTSPPPTSPPPTSPPPTSPPPTTPPSGGGGGGVGF
jgi:predicted lipoprotein with Yx(FWY)xxD motif